MISFFVLISANPFGGVTSTPGMPAFSNPAPNASVNPFAAANPMGQFSQAGNNGISMPAASAATSFASQFPPAASGFNQFSSAQTTAFSATPPQVPNGGFGSAVFGQTPFPMSAQQMPAQQMPAQQMPAQQAAWGNMTQGNSGGPSTANPFLVCIACY